MTKLELGPCHFTCGHGGARDWFNNFSDNKISQANPISMFNKLLASKRCKKTNLYLLAYGQLWLMAQWIANPVYLGATQSCLSSGCQSYCRLLKCVFSIVEGAGTGIGMEYGLWRSQCHLGKQLVLAAVDSYIPRPFVFQEVCLECYVYAHLHSTNRK